MMKAILLVIALTAITTVQSQNTDTIHAGDGQLNLARLPKGTQCYLVYIKTAEGKKRNIWLWERTVTREKWHDSDAIVVRQQWTTSDTGFNQREVLSVVDPVTFTPTYHSTQNPKTGGEVYNLYAPEFLAVDPIADAVRKKNKVYPIVTTHNWELDLETFPLLPLQEGKTFVISFYHPGSKTLPAWYSYTVTGSERIATVNGEWADCFKLYTEYGNNRGNSIWWLSKKTHEVLKMEEHFGSITRYKIKLATPE